MIESTSAPRERDRALSHLIELAQGAGLSLDLTFRSQVVSQVLQQMSDPMAIAQACQQSSVGKKLPGALYVHRTALNALVLPLRLYEACARYYAGDPDAVTLIKFALDGTKISYLFYPEFETDAHPALDTSLQVALPSGQLSYRDYRTSNSPPVLHRKETFVTSDYPHYHKFAQLTQAEEQLGLFDHPSSIGTKSGWRRCLEEAGIEIEDHYLLCPRDGNPAIPKIERHRAATVRTDLSRPVRFALEVGLFRPQTTFFDYGCGHGGDVKRMARKGYQSAGWDPYYAPDKPIESADIVNLGYVINVIEDTAERRETLLKAWKLTQKVLVVSAQVAIVDRQEGQVLFGDGVITRRHTFQKYYEQEELKVYIEQVLGVEAMPVALGIYFVFRDESEAEGFRATRWRSRTTTPKVRRSDKRFEDYQDLLAPLMQFVSDRGRLPVRGELVHHPEILVEFGSFRLAFKTILQATDPEAWEAIAEKRRQDLLVYQALSHFSKGSRRKLPPEVKNDLKALFGTLKEAFEIADEMLFSVGDLAEIAQLCQRSPVGLVTPTSLCVHVSAMEALDPLLRIYEGCASRTIGRMEWANVIEIHTNKPKISYLLYPDFDTDPHPALHTAMEIDLRDLQVGYHDFDPSENPPILHRKEKLVTPDYPLYEKWAKLSQQEENRGLLDNPKAIRRRNGWQNCLREHCAELKGYRVYWRQDADPYQVKILKAAQARRQKTKRRDDGQDPMESDRSQISPKTPDLQ